MLHIVTKTDRLTGLCGAGLLTTDEAGVEAGRVDPISAAEICPICAGVDQSGRAEFADADAGCVAASRAFAHQLREALGNLEDSLLHHSRNEVEQDLRAATALLARVREYERHLERRAALDAEQVVRRPGPAMDVNLAAMDMVSVAKRVLGIPG